MWYVCTLRVVCRVGFFVYACFVMRSRSITPCKFFVYMQVSLHMLWTMENRAASYIERMIKFVWQLGDPRDFLCVHWRSFHRTSTTTCGFLFCGGAAFCGHIDSVFLWINVERHVLYSTVIGSWYVLLWRFVCVWPRFTLNVKWSRIGLKSGVRHSTRKNSGIPAMCPSSSQCNLASFCRFSLSWRLLLNRE